VLNCRPNLFSVRSGYIATLSWFNVQWNRLLVTSIAEFAEFPLPLRVVGAYTRGTFYVYTDCSAELKIRNIMIRDFVMSYLMMMYQCYL
jgi:hypothetical protein